MKSSNELKDLLHSIHKKSYPAYKSLKGTYDFLSYRLSIDHVQGDPFASPSAVSLLIPHRTAGFPASYYESFHTRTALEDFLTRLFCQQTERYSFKARGSGKSGLISVSQCGQEILSRTSVEIAEKAICVRFHVGFPARGRTIDAEALETMIFDYLPQAVRKSFYYKNLDAAKVKEVFYLAEDQYAIRQELKKRELVAFIADGSVLPRESGVSQKPMKNSVPFHSPESQAVVLDLPHRGKLRGMGISKGITLIVGGGYHGKSTLLNALELGVYNHIPGDGREYVITDETALKLRAEDGRCIKNTDISLFINDLPNKKDTHHFTTEDASGSTSQAANIIEGIQAGSTVFLIDEDTSATNFMVRDEFMQQVIKREKEPITPFLERARDLYETAGISTILVAGSSGSYFHIADTILQMDCYRTLDITARVKELCRQYPSPALKAPAFCMPGFQERIFADIPSGGSNNRRMRGKYDGFKLKVHDKDTLLLNKTTVDLRYVEQLQDIEQTRALGYLLKYSLEHYPGQKISLTRLVQTLEKQLKESGFQFLFSGSYIPAGLALPRIQEIYACFNRYRG